MANLSNIERPNPPAGGNEFLPGNSGPIESEAYAGFWVRAMALLIDGVIVVAINAVVSLALMKSGTAPGSASQVIMALFLPMLYFAGLHSSRWQATVGKKVFGLEVVDMDGDRISFPRALVRYLATVASAAPLFLGYVAAGLTSKKQAVHDFIANSLVMNRRPGEAFKAAITTIFLAAVVGWGTLFYVVPWTMQNAVETAVVDFADDARNSLTQLAMPTKGSAELHNEQLVQTSATPKLLSDADYAALLSQPLSGMDSTNAVMVGPGQLVSSNFWESDGDPHMWLEVALPKLPNLDLGGRPVTIDITRVTNAAGRDVYNADSNFEGPFFRSLGLTSRTSPVAHLGGIRDVHLLAGTRDSDVKRVQGSMVLSIPARVHEVRFREGDFVVGRNVGQVSITITSIENSRVSYSWGGPGNRYIGIRAYNKYGQELATKGGSQPSPDEVYEGENGRYPLSYQFSGKIETVAFLVAEGFTSHTYPFDLTRP